jgi:hypothetical protein
MTYRNKRLTDLAHDMPCCAQFKHDCNDFNGCVPMHSDHHIFGRGAWHKSHDFAFAAGCPNAHAILTAKVNDDLERDQKFFDWMRAHVKTMEWLWTNGKLKVAA